MKKLIKFIFICLILSSYSAFAENLDDNQLIDALSWSNDNKTDVKTLDFDFKLQKFSSCDEMSQVLSEYVKKVSKNNNRWWFIDYATNSMVKWMAIDDVAMEESTADSSMMEGLGWWWDDDYSETNIQVEWVDEPEIVKTDGKNIYYMSEYYDYDSNKYRKAIFFMKNNSWKLELKRKLNLPEHFAWTELYITEWQLIIVATWYPKWEFQTRFWRNSDAKTYVIVMDTKDIDNAKIAKVHMFEWYYTQSRLIWDNLYVIWNKNFYYNMYYKNNDDDIKIEPEDIIAKQLELNYTNDSSKKNVEISWKNMDYNVEFWDAVKCEDIEYVLPDDATMKKYWFNPSFNIISVINLKDLNKKVKNTVVLWDISEIHMSKESLYLTSYIYTNYDFKCGNWFKCVSRYPRWENTSIHKFSIQKDASLAYANSTIVNWNPLTQYSMDENNGDFRIITSSWYPKSATNLFVLDKDLSLLSSITWIAEWETFRSSRFMWDKLYLVTFEQVDPLFVIDLKDNKNPKIIWELKIPWYSTYLHPYDQNHLIWLWYDTIDNWYWSPMNAWVKIDLYEINYDKKCWDEDLTSDEKLLCKEWTYKWILVKQLYTKTLWTVWSESEALYNPRMFVWNAKKNLLLLPARTYENYDKKNYSYSWFYSWLYAMKIDKNSWIKEEFRISNIEESKFEDLRNEECKKYISDNKESSKCVKLIDWSEYCPSTNRNYVPEYCYEWASISDFIAHDSYKYHKYFTKRALYIWDYVYAISDAEAISYDTNARKQVSKVELD